MSQMKKLGQQLQTALALDIPAELVALVITTSNPKRLRELFCKASIRLLEAHRDVLQHPNSAGASFARVRSKALLDLVRARIAAIGVRKPTADRILGLMDQHAPGNVIDIRKAA